MDTELYEYLKKSVQQAKALRAGKRLNAETPAPLPANHDSISHPNLRPKEKNPVL